MNNKLSRLTMRFFYVSRVELVAAFFNVWMVASILANNGFNVDGDSEVALYHQAAEHWNIHMPHIMATILLVSAVLQILGILNILNIKLYKIGAVISTVFWVFLATNFVFGLGLSIVSGSFLMAAWINVFSLERIGEKQHSTPNAIQKGAG
jgi:hypothetical protein